MRNLYNWYRAANALYRRKIPILPGFIKFLIRILFGAVIPYEVQIGSGTTFGYFGLGVVIHKRAVIGKGCHIGQGVTIGGTSHNPALPTIGDDVFLGAGAKVLGAVDIGAGSVIGANAVVTKDIPPHCLAVGVPAKVVKTDISVSDYL